MALEQKELDQEPGAGKWVISRTGCADWDLVKVAIRWRKWIGSDSVSLAQDLTVV